MCDMTMTSYGKFQILLMHCHFHHYINASSHSICIFHHRPFFTTVTTMPEPFFGHQPVFRDPAKQCSTATTNSNTTSTCQRVNTHL